MSGRKSTNKKTPQSQTNIGKDIISGIFVVIALVIVDLVKMVQFDSYDPLHSYLNAQAGLGCVYVNILALLSTTYGKATIKFHVNGATYLLSMLGYILIVNIFAQAVFMIYPNVPLFAGFMRSQVVAIIFNVAFFVDLIILSCLPGEQEYIKEKLK